MFWLKKIILQKQKEIVVREQGLVCQNTYTGESGSYIPHLKTDPLKANTVKVG